MIGSNLISSVQSHAYFFNYLPFPYCFDKEFMVSCSFVYKKKRRDRLAGSFCGKRVSRNSNTLCRLHRKRNRITESDS